MSDTDRLLPLAGIRVVEFTHMVMGPTCGLILADLGADVIKIEPPEGDRTRKLPGWGMGFFRTYNRNKRSVTIDLSSEEGRSQALDVIASADVMIENFRPGRMRDLGLDHATLSKRFPRLIYASLKGFLAGPYQHRTALDEAVQMMGGLAYMTGPPGNPMRAGASVNDVMGGMFGAIGILAAINERQRTGVGQEVQASIFENCVFLVGQHMQHAAMTGKAVDPLPARQPLFAVYDVFTFRDARQLFIAATSDRHWRALCKLLDRADLASDESLTSNASRCVERPRLVPLLREIMGAIDADDMAARCDANGVPYSPILRPDELFGDPHLVATGGLGAVRTEEGDETRVPLLPLLMSGERLPTRKPIPALGEHTDEVIGALSRR